MKLQLPVSIYMTRGKIVHSALEDFFKISIDGIADEHYEFELNVILQSFFKKRWEESNEELNTLGLTEQKLSFFYDDSVSMLNNWFEGFMHKLSKKTDNSSLKESFEELKPETEAYFKSEEHKVQGYIDAIQKIDGKVSIIDYKTSRRDDVTDDYKLQLAIYAMLYEEKYRVLPDYVGIDFLKHKLKYYPVNREMVDMAKREAKLIQEKTISEDIGDYQSSNHHYCECSKYQELIERTTLNKFIDQNI
jgi:CRISPR/Cas system-associated exonuclease Cas4 (RecB family)